VELSAGVDGVLQASVAGSGSGERDTIVTFDPGCTFAYLLFKPEWGKGSDKDLVVDLSDDQQGFA
jgi:hypothetical protein